MRSPKLEQKFPADGQEYRRLFRERGEPIRAWFHY
jgi:hypothetical protein